MRIAWCALLSLLIVLFAARPAAAASVGAGPPTLGAGPLFGLPIPLAGDDEAEDEEFDEEELEESEEEVAEEDEEAEAEESALPPTDCLLQTTRAKVSVYAAKNKVRLQIRYTSTAPTDATVAYRLTGSRGPLKFPEAKQHLALAGSIRLSANLTDSAMSKAVAAKSFVVELRIPATPRACRRFDTRHLTIERGSSRRETWLQA